VRSKLDERTEETLREIGTLFRRARKEAGMSQAQLAAEIAMDRENYAKIERAEINVTVDTLVRIAAGLGMRLSLSLMPGVSRKGTRQ
jgi:transcriptional regulator with XRE-family HTH domain